MPAPPERARAQRATRAIRSAATRLDQSLDALGLDDAIRTLHDAEQAKVYTDATIDRARDVVRARLLAAGNGVAYSPTGYVVDKLPPIKCSTTGKSTHWDGRRVASVVAARCLDECVDPETGEVLPASAIVAKVTDEIVTCAGLDAKSKSWKKDSLRSRGIDPDLYFEESGGRKTVRWL